MPFSVAAGDTVGLSETTGFYTSQEVRWSYGDVSNEVKKVCTCSNDILPTSRWALRKRSRSKLWAISFRTRKLRSLLHRKNNVWLWKPDRLPVGHSCSKGQNQNQNLGLKNQISSSFSNKETHNLPRARQRTSIIKTGYTQRRESIQYMNYQMLKWCLNKLQLKRELWDESFFLFPACSSTTEMAKCYTDLKGQGGQINFIKFVADWTEHQHFSYPGNVHKNSCQKSATTLSGSLISVSKSENDPIIFQSKPKNPKIWIKTSDFLLFTSHSTKRFWCLHDDITMSELRQQVLKASFRSPGRRGFSLKNTALVRK